MTGTVTSKDGTAIAFEHTGTGPPLILVDAAGHSRAFSSFDGLSGLLAADFTVYQYDRRGRGGSGDTAPYAVEREVEDLAVLIDLAGGSAFLYGYSSGSLVVLHAAAAGLSVRALALLEPPIPAPDELADQRAFTTELARLLEVGKPEAAVEFFLTGIGVPNEILAGMRGTHPWSAMVDIAYTLVYDSLIGEASTTELLSSVQLPALVLDSSGSSDDITGMAATVAAAMPNATHQTLPGEWHGVADEVLAPALSAFFTVNADDHQRSSACFRSAPWRSSDGNRAEEAGVTDGLRPQD